MTNHCQPQESQELGPGTQGILSAPAHKLLVLSGGRCQAHSHLRAFPLVLWPSHTLKVPSLLPSLPSALCSNAVLSIEPNIGSLRDKPLLTISLLLSWHLQLYCHYLGADCLSPKPKYPLKSCLSSGLRTGTGINIPLGA